MLLSNDSLDDPKASQIASCTVVHFECQESNFPKYIFESKFQFVNLRNSFNVFSWKITCDN